MQVHVLTCAVACALGLPALALAQDDTATDLDEVVVTATRTATTVDASLAPVEVIDRAEIERSQATSLPDLLRGRAGINLSNQGGAGKLSTVFVRGTESDHVLVLIDGVRVGSATSGLAAFQDLPVALIDRIEIVRGPRSSLYGSDAIGGVIQIFTRRDRGRLLPHASASVGSNGFAEGSAGVGAGGERGWFGVDAAYQNVEGFNACNVAMPDPFSGGCFIAAPEADDDGYRNRSLSLRGGVNAGEQWQFTAHALRSEGRNQYDGDFVNLSKTVQQVLGGKAQWRPSERVQVQLLLGNNSDVSDNFLHKSGLELDMGYFDTDRDSATVQADFGLATGHTLTTGVDWLRDRVDSDTEFAEDERDNTAAFVQYQGHFGRHDLQLALRRDDNEQFGGETTGGVAWGLSFAERWRVTASYGTAFKAPTFNELYFPFFGNPNLRPESSKSWEAGIAWRGERSSVRLDAFQTDVDDLIAFDASLFLPNNIEKARLRGAELRFDSEFAGWDLGASASWLDPKNRSVANPGNDLPRRAGETARIELDRNFGKFRLGFTGVAEGSRYDDVANTRRMDSFATLDVRAEYAFASAWSLQARVANVFDEDYETSSFYNQAGREFFVTLRYQPTR